MRWMAESIVHPRYAHIWVNYVVKWNCLLAYLRQQLNPLSFCVLHFMFYSVLKVIIKIQTGPKDVVIGEFSIERRMIFPGYFTNVTTNVATTKKSISVEYSVNIFVIFEGDHFVSKSILLVMISGDKHPYLITIGVLDLPFLFSTGLSWYDSATMLLSKTHLCKCFLYCPISSLISLIISYIMSQ